MTDEVQKTMTTISTHIWKFSTIRESNLLAGLDVSCSVATDCLPHVLWNIGICHARMIEPRDEDEESKKIGLVELPVLVAGNGEGEVIGDEEF